MSGSAKSLEAERGKAQVVHARTLQKLKKTLNGSKSQELKSSSKAGQLRSVLRTGMTPNCGGTAFAMVIRQSIPEPSAKTQKVKMK